MKRLSFLQNEKILNLSLKKVRGPLEQGLVCVRTPYGRSYLPPFGCQFDLFFLLFFGVLTSLVMKAINTTSLLVEWHVTSNLLNSFIITKKEKKRKEKQNL